MAGSSVVPKLLCQSCSEDAGDGNGLPTSSPASGAQPVPVGDVLEAGPARESGTPGMLQLFSPAGIFRIQLFL